MRWFRRRVKPRTKVHGVIWRWDRADRLTVEEYEHWMGHVLPFGWSIIAKPEAYDG